MMNPHFSVTASWVGRATLVALLALGGCGRSGLDGILWTHEHDDGGLRDGGGDGSTDGFIDGSVDGGTDGFVDGGRDGSTDGSRPDGFIDGGRDGSTDGSLDSGHVDAGTDGFHGCITFEDCPGGFCWFGQCVPDWSTDGGRDASADAGWDGGRDGSTDGGRPDLDDGGGGGWPCYNDAGENQCCGWCWDGVCLGTKPVDGSCGGDWGGDGGGSDAGPDSGSDAGTDMRVPPDMGHNPDMTPACSLNPEVCNNGKDDNCNGLSDCADPACAAFPSCLPAVEICDNGIDDDRNGLVDCKDPWCASFPGCTPAGVEICNNGLDDDHNGLVDCADTACLGFPGCSVHVCDPRKPNCADPACISNPACQNLQCQPSIDFGMLQPHDSRSERSFSTVGTMDVAMTSCAPGGAGMTVTTFQVAQNATAVRLDYTQSAGADHVFALFRAGVNQKCEANPIDCYDPMNALSGTHTWVLDQGRYYLIVQPFQQRSQGTVDATLSTPASSQMEICDNGADDDGNGLIDCSDPACVGTAACAGQECKPDIVLGTVRVGNGGSKSTSFTTSGAGSDDTIRCGGKGADVAVQFTLAETAGIGMDFNQGFGADHIIGLFKKPGFGKNCDASSLDCLDPGGNSPSIAWGEYPPGDYIFIFKAVQPGKEGRINATIYAYKNQGVELCHNGIDDDGNGLVDCADPACANDAMCGPPICAPDQDFGVLNVGGMTRSTTLDLRGGVAGLSLSCSNGGRARVVQFELPQHAGLGVNCSNFGGSEAVLGLFSEADARKSCDQHELSCADPQVLPFGCNYIWPNLQAGTYYVIAQAFKPGTEGSLNLQLYAVEDRVLEICNNDIDDDGDGYTDCADRKCATSPYCTARACKADASIDPMPVNGMTMVESLDTTSEQPTAQPSCESQPGGGNAVVYVNLPRQATLTVEYLQSFGMTNHVFALYPVIGQGLVCEAAPALACIPSDGAKNGTAVFDNVPKGGYWLVVAADHPGSEGPIFINLSAM